MYKITIDITLLKSYNIYRKQKETGIFDMKNIIKKTTLIILSIIILLSISITSLAETISENTSEKPEDTIIFDESEFGDVNNDGKKTAADARLLLRCSAHLEDISVRILTYGDYDKNGKITSADARTALRIAASLENITCVLHGHNFSSWTETKESRSKSCKRCNYTQVIKIESSEKIIYLTFDDGPGAYTRTLLDYLSEYDVKATFFVTNQNPNYIHLLKDIVDEGHAIGVHTLTHQWSIYSSEESYLKDFNAMHDIIKDKTGVDTKLFRFPGGTNNTISKNYSTGIMATLCETMTDSGYLYFDWNVDCGDTAGYGSEEIAQTTIEQIKNRKNSIILMHDIKKSTVEAIKTIIEFGLENGYEFKPLDESSPTVHFKPAN